MSHSSQSIGVNICSENRQKWKIRVYRRVHEGRPLIRTLKQINTLHTLTSCFSLKTSEKVKFSESRFQYFGREKYSCRI